MLFKVGIALVICLLVKDGRAVKCGSCSLVYSEEQPSRGQVNDGTVEEYTKVMYSGMFKTCDEMGFEDCELTGLKKEGSLSYRCHHWYNDDGDMCCSTRRYYIIPYQVSDGSYPVHFPWLGSYQYLQIGLCGEAGDCRGRCVEQWVSARILVCNNPINNPWDFFLCAWLGQLRFETFSYPGYCKCARIIWG